jgi:hypothetical protein
MLRRRERGCAEPNEGMDGNRMPIGDEDERSLGKYGRTRGRVIGRDEREDPWWTAEFGSGKPSMAPRWNGPRAALRIATCVIDTYLDGRRVWGGWMMSSIELGGLIA